MNKIDLILPGSGSTGWGNGINKNFLKLLQEQHKLQTQINEIAAVTTRKDALQLSTEQFVYITSDGNAYLVPVANWENPTTSTRFDPSAERDMTAYVVQVKGNDDSNDDSGQDADTSISYGGQSWFTNDILYIYKDLNNINNVNRWPSSIGGYYIPNGVQLEQGKVTTNFIRKPAFLTDDVVKSVKLDFGIVPNAKLVEGEYNSRNEYYEWSSPNILVLYTYHLSDYVYNIQFFDTEGKRVYLDYGIEVGLGGAVITLPDGYSGTGAKFIAEFVFGNSEIDDSIFTKTSTAGGLKITGFNSVITAAIKNGIKTLVIPNQIGGEDVKLIEIALLDGFDSLSTITTPIWDFYDRNLQEQRVPDALRTIIFTYEYTPADGACQCLSQVTNVIISNDITEIPTALFTYCTGLVSVYIGEGVTTIGAGAFSKCSSLTNIVIPDSVTSIGQQAFVDCEGLKSVTILGSSITIQADAFLNCPNIENITAPSTAIVVIPKSKLKTVIITSGNIGNELLKLCTTLKTVKINDAITNIGEGVFFHCYALENVTIGSGITKIPDGTFTDCHSLQKITIPNNIIEIGVEAFKGCNNLKDVDFPINLQLIDERAFSGCSSLKTLTLNGDALEIYGEAFYNCGNITDISIGSGVSYIGYSAFAGCSSLENITLPFVGQQKFDTFAEPPAEKGVFGYIFGTSSYSNSIEVAQVYYTNFLPPPEVFGHTSYYIPASLTKVRITGASLMYGAFSNCKMLHHIIVDEYLNTEHPQHIDDYSFFGCSSLESITLPFAGYKKDASGIPGLFGGIFGSGPYDNSIKVTQHYSLDGYKDYYLPLSLHSVEITSATALRYGAFSNCSMLVDITFGNSLTTIEEQVFDGCSGLHLITFNSEEPPTLNSDPFPDQEFYSIRVPKDCLQSYIEADYWSNFKSKIFAIAEVEPIIDLIYPVGAIIETTVHTSPSKYLLGTIWYLYGLGEVTIGIKKDDSDFNIVGKTGGTKIIETGKLSINAATGDTDVVTEVSNDNLQPYIVVYRWRRVA